MPSAWVPHGGKGELGEIFRGWSKEGGIFLILFCLAIFSLEHAFVNLYSHVWLMEI